MNSIKRRLKSDAWYNAEETFIKKLMNQYEVVEEDAVEIHEYLMENDPAEFLTHLFKIEKQKGTL